MRIVVTGGQGFIGRQVVPAATEQGDDVHVLDLADGCDVRDADSTRAALAGADVVVHLAAKVGVEQGLDDVADYVSHNAVGTSVVLAAAAACGVPRVVLASSMVVYGDGIARCAEHGEVRPAPRRAVDLREGRFEPPCPTCGAALSPMLVGEDVPADPRSGYALTKACQEQLAELWARQSDGSVVALRFHNVYGPGLPRDTPYAGVAAIFRSAVLSGQAPVVTEDGAQRRDLVHVRDVARACVVAAHTDVVAPGTLRAYNVGSGTVRTVLDLATVMSDAAGGPPPVVSGQGRLTDVRHITASSERAARELGWRATEDFAAGVRELLSEPG
ncbi:NAD-dependent epimerase/dehydratase family protein [Angustibacter luteus]|uniref:NAD-dependent epimerase/dehydratase family protein n=1 Tax=Angustibacter luteus TaxID=658456 RepID=A0ABW1JBT7_9ACTN